MAEFVCGVREKYLLYLSACKKLRQYQDTGYCVLHFPGEKKKEDFEQVKKDKLEQEDYDFSGTVFPEGTSDFRRVVFDGNADFTGATFLGKADFQDARFSGERTNFRRAQFSGEWTSFQRAQFSGDAWFPDARFSDEWTSFSGTQFTGDAWFPEAQFTGNAWFQDAQFSGETTAFQRAQFSGEWTSFVRAQFSSAKTSFVGTQFVGSAETSFQEATFAKEVYFTGVTFGEKVIFWGTQGNLVFGPGAWAKFDRPRIEKPEQFTFNTVLLHPGWFINADVRKVDFTDVKWYGMPGGPEGTIEAEVKALEERGVESPYTLLSQACRRLSANAEENREYPRANEFHYWSMDALRIGRWRYLGWLRQFIKKNWRRISARFGLIATLLWIWRILRREPLRHTMPSRFGLVPTFYWALSGYGVRAGRAFWILVAIWAAFTTLYVLVDPSEFKDLGQGIGYRWQAAVYSLLALVRLNPEPKPEEPGVFQFLVGLEGILGPLQIALLALAIRRKVMR